MAKQSGNEEVEPDLNSSEEEWRQHLSRLGIEARSVLLYRRHSKLDTTPPFTSVVFFNNDGVFERLDGYEGACFVHDNQHWRALWR